jgi:hypothetical protein
MIFAWFTALPRSAKLALAALAGLLLAWGLWSLWLRSHDRAVIERHEEAITAKTSERASDAAADATKAVADTTARVEQENEDARNAADGSDDPLRAALDSLQ